MTKDQTKISSVEILDEYTGQSLESDNIEIYYYDTYGNTRSMYYIYKMEYAFKKWQIHKLSKKQFTEYTNNIIDNLSDKKILDKLFSKSNFEKFEKLSTLIMVIHFHLFSSLIKEKILRTPDSNLVCLVYSYKSVNIKK